MRPEPHHEGDDPPREPVPVPAEPHPVPGQDVRTDTAGEMTRHETGEIADTVEPPD